MSPGPPRRPFERSPRALAVPRRTQPRCRNRTKSSFPQSSPRALQVTVKRRNDGKDPPLRGAAASRKTPRVESGAVSRRDVRRPLPRRRSRPSDFASQSSPPAPPADAVVLPVPRRLRLLAGQRAAGKEDGGRRTASSRTRSSPGRPRRPAACPPAPDRPPPPSPPAAGSSPDGAWRGRTPASSPGGPAVPPARRRPRLGGGRRGLLRLGCAATPLLAGEGGGRDPGQSLPGRRPGPPSPADLPGGVVAWQRTSPTSTHRGLRERRRVGPRPSASTWSAGGAEAVPRGRRPAPPASPPRCREAPHRPRGGVPNGTLLVPLVRPGTPGGAGCGPRCTDPPPGVPGRHPPPSFPGTSFTRTPSPSSGSSSTTTGGVRRGRAGCPRRSPGPAARSRSTTTPRAGGVRVERRRRPPVREDGGSGQKDSLPLGGRPARGLRRPRRRRSTRTARARVPVGGVAVVVDPAREEVVLAPAIPRRAAETSSRSRCAAVALACLTGR